MLVEQTSTSPVPLAGLREGQRARLCETRLECDECALLCAMGLTDQCEIRVCQVGEPCIVEVHATRLGLSASLASRLLVTPIGEGD